MENRNASLAKFWAIWEYRSKKEKISWTQFMKNFDFTEHFELTIDNEIEKLEGPLSLFDSAVNSEVSFIKNQAKIFEEKLAHSGIKSLIKDDFKNFPALKDIKGANWFFYRGNIEILNNSVSSFASVIGSRSTEPNWKNWIIEALPKDKIIISGLANGADTLGHQVAIENNQQIVIFPAIDILELNFPNQIAKREIVKYAIAGKGLIISDIFPGSKNFDKTIFLNRNRWMAQMSNETYVVYFNGISGTLGQMTETIKLGRKIYLPREVLMLNREFLDNHKSFVDWREKLEAK